MRKIKTALRAIMVKIKWLIFVKLYKMDISPTAKLSLKVKLDGTNPKGVHIGDETYVAANAMILTHDFVNAVHRDTYIGKRCFIGSNVMIMPGLTIGNEVVIGGGGCSYKRCAF